MITPTISDEKRMKLDHATLGFLYLLVTLTSALGRADVAGDSLEQTVFAGTTQTSSDFLERAVGGRVRLGVNTRLNFSSTAVTTGSTDFNLSHLAVMTSAEQGGWLIDMTAGLYQRRTDLRDPALVPQFETSVAKSVTETLKLSGAGGYTLFAQDLQTAFSFNEMVRGGFYRLASDWRALSRLRISGFHRQTFLSDSNRREQEDLSALYGISTDWPWIWVGAGAEHLSNTSTDGRYWSPRGFFSYGPRFDVAFPLGERFSFAAGLNVSLFDDLDFGTGQGYYALTKVTYKSSETWSIDVAYEGIKAEQNGNQWRSDSLRVGVLWNP